MSLVKAPGGVGKLQVEINDEKSRTVDLERGECFGFLGFEFRYLRGLSGSDAAALHAQAQKADGAGAGAQRGVPPTPVATIERVIGLINPVLRGWVNYFAVGHSSEVLQLHQRLGGEEGQAPSGGMLRNERASAGNDGIGGGCTTLLGLFNAYRVRRRRAESRPSRIGPISFGVKQMGARNAGNPHVACDAGGGWRRGVGRDPRATTARQPSTLPMSGMWKRSYGRTSKAPPDERGGNGYVLPNATAPHLDSTKS